MLDLREGEDFENAQRFAANVRTRDLMGGARETRDGERDTHRYATFVCWSIFASLSKRGSEVLGSLGGWTSSTAASEKRGRASANPNSHVPRLVRRG